MKYIAILFVALLAAPVAAETLRGQPEVVDGDTLQIDRTRVRLFGIDAPELSQTCARAGERWACGKASADRLRSLIGDSVISCAGDEVDQYGRLVATCNIVGTDLNEAMVADGWATAFRRYSDRYVNDELRARAAKRGLWSSIFEAPADYRKEERARTRPAVTVAPRVATRSAQGCVIKGNRNRRGQWIYHLPGTPYYEQTRAEEMFCSEAEAQAAGYRRSRAQ